MKMSKEKMKSLSWFSTTTTVWAICGFFVWGFLVGKSFFWPLYHEFVTKLYHYEQTIHQFLRLDWGFNGRFWKALHFLAIQEERDFGMWLVQWQTKSQARYYDILRKPKIFFATNPRSHRNIQKKKKHPARLVPARTAKQRKKAKNVRGILKETEIKFLIKRGKDDCLIPFFSRWNSYKYHRTQRK